MHINEIIQQYLSLKTPGASKNEVYHEMLGLLQACPPEGDYALELTQMPAEQMLKQEYAMKNKPAVIKFKGTLHHTFWHFFKGRVIIVQKLKPLKQPRVV